jgi:hypothetical protein
VVQDLLVVTSPLSRGRGLTLDRLDGLQACEGSKGTGRRNADAGGDGDETLEHVDGSVLRVSEYFDEYFDEFWMGCG